MNRDEIIALLKAAKNVVKWNPENREIKKLAEALAAFEEKNK